MKDKLVAFSIVFGVIVGASLTYLGMSYLFMKAFNYVANYFGFKEITFWVAVAIVFVLGFIGRTSARK